MLVISTSDKGHFINYFNLIRKHYGNGGCRFLLVTLRNMFGLRFVRLSIGYDKFLFLHGEAQLKEMIFLRVIRPKAEISTIFYYSFFEGRYFKTLVYKLLGFLNIRCLALEADAEVVEWGLSPIYDPVLGGVVKRRKKDTQGYHFLVAGYLDDRKSIREIVASLDRVCSEGVACSLQLVGEVDENLKEYLNSIWNKNYKFTLEVDDRRVSDDALNEYISNADCVLAIYKNHSGSSGFVIKSIASRVPVLFIPNPALNKYRKLIKLDRLPEYWDEESIYSALKSFVRHSDDFYDETELSKFNKDHSEKVFVRSVIGG